MGIFTQDAEIPIDTTGQCDEISLYASEGTPGHAHKTTSETPMDN